MSDNRTGDESERGPGWFGRHPRIARALAFTLFLLVLDIALGTLLFHLGIVVLPAAGYLRVPDSRLHHSLRPNVDYKRAHFGTLEFRVLTNSLGCRDSVIREVSRTKVTKRRLLLIGDSFTEGIGCDWEDTFAGMLQKDLGEEWEVLNAGVATYCPVIYYCRGYRLLVEEGIEVDEVFVLIDPGDIREENKYWLASDDPPTVGFKGTLFDERFKSFVGTHTVLLKAARYGLRHLRHIARFEETRTGERSMTRNALWGDTEELMAEVGRPGLEKASRHLDLLANLLRGKGVRLTIAVYPYPTHVTRRQHDFPNFTFWRDWTRERGHGFVNLAPAFFFAGPAEKVLDELFIEGDVHWNRAGHRLVANEFLKELRGR